MPKPRIPITALSSIFIILFWVSCIRSDNKVNQELRETLQEIADNAPGKVGIALIDATDTLTVNNDYRYPMMSVFKLHQALAVCNRLYVEGRELDSMLVVFPDEIDRETWSPVIGNHADTPFGITVKELLDASLTTSDNNASNILFNRIVNPVKADSIIRIIAPDQNFAIKYSEAEMKLDYRLGNENYSSPLSAAMLISDLMTGKIDYIPQRNAIINMLREASTGKDRIAVGIEGIAGATLAHKTGSGSRDESGRLTAHNDVGFITLPNGKSYALAVFITDFEGSDAQASAIIAEISKIVATEMMK